MVLEPRLPRLFDLSHTDKPKKPNRLRPIPALIFASRWLQLPLYLDLIVAQCAYVYQFWQELVHLVDPVWALGRIETEITQGNYTREGRTIASSRCSSTVAGSSHQPV